VRIDRLLFPDKNCCSAWWRWPQAYLSDVGAGCAEIPCKPPASHTRLTFSVKDSDQPFYSCNSRATRWSWWPQRDTRTKFQGDQECNISRADWENGEVKLPVFPEDRLAGEIWPASRTKTPWAGGLLCDINQPYTLARRYIILNPTTCRPPYCYT